MKDILDRIAESSPTEEPSELICRLRDCASEIEALRAKQAPAVACEEIEHRLRTEVWTLNGTATPPLGEQQAAAGWVSVADRLPESGKTVLATYQNRLGKLRRIRAQYIGPKTREHYTDYDELDVEYDETTDTYYWAAGWYECIDNWGDYSHVAVSEGAVTHWMPMPDAPVLAAAKGDGQ